MLRELDAGDVPELLVANKLDLAEPDELAALRAAGALPLSAVTGEGVEKFLDALAERLRALNAVVEASLSAEGARAHLLLLAALTLAALPLAPLAAAAALRQALD